MTTKTSLITSRDRKGRHAVGLFEVAYDSAQLTEDQAQMLNQNGGEFQRGIRELIARLTLTSQFADEEVASSYTYPAGYQGAHPIVEQADCLRAAFTGLGSMNEKLAEQPLPSIAEGWFAIPRWEKIAPTYNEAVEIVLAKIAKTRPFYNYREGQLGAQQLRQSARSAAFWQKLTEQQQGHDILVVPAQFGLRHRGKSVRRVRALMEGTQEFGLGAYEVGMMLLTHPERMTSYDDLWLDCPGDEYVPGAGGSFVIAPGWSFYDGKLKFDTKDVANCYGDYGSASAVLPE